MNRTTVMSNEIHECFGTAEGRHTHIHRKVLDSDLKYFSFCFFGRQLFPSFQFSFYSVFFMEVKG